MVLLSALDQAELTLRLSIASQPSGFHLLSGFCTAPGSPVSLNRYSVGHWPDALHSEFLPALLACPVYLLRSGLCLLPSAHIPLTDLLVLSMPAGRRCIEKLHTGPDVRTHRLPALNVAHPCLLRLPCRPTLPLSSCPVCWKRRKRESQQMLLSTHGPHPGTGQSSTVPPAPVARRC